MPRHTRRYYETPFFHVIVQGINREFIFDKERDTIKYLQIIEKNLEKTEVEIIAYCIMNNHAHFLIYSKSIEQMSMFMSKINTSFAKYYNKEKERVGYVFRDRYISEPIMNERYLIKCINYIHNNPVKANMVGKCAEYKYSSYKEFLNNEKIEKICEITNIKFDSKLFIEAKVEEEFLDIDTDRKEMILKKIYEFLKKRKIELYKICEDREILKELIVFLKSEYSIKYTEMMDIMNITKGAMQKLKIG